MYRRIKEAIDSDLHTFNIISDLIDGAGIVMVIRGINQVAGSEIKGKKLREEWSW